MFRLLIADDEPVMIQGICSIPWENYGIQIAATASNGSEAFRKSIEYKPDIILCDINMPHVNGLDFAKRIEKNLPVSKIILITGYSEQSYMLEAIRAHVFSYLIKPVNANELIEEVIKAKNCLLEEKREHENNAKNSQLINENISYLQSLFIQSLISDKHTSYTENTIREKSHSLNLNFDGDYYTVLMTQTLEKESILFISQILSLIRPSLTFCVCPVDDATTILLNSTYPLTDSIIKSVSDEICSQMMITLFYSNCLASYTLLPEICDQLHNCLNHSIWFSAGSYSCNQNFDKDMTMLTQAKKELVKEIHAGHQASLVNYLMIWFNELENVKVSNKVFFNEIYSILSLRQNGATPMEWTWKTVEDAKNDLLNSFACSSRFRYDGQINRILKYIDQHHRENLTLQKVADDLYISPTYLSRLLKEKTEIGFTNWLRYFRIKDAQDIIKTTDLLNYEIAELVGYNSYKIFAEHFYKETGMNTKEYKLMSHVAPIQTLHKITVPP